MCREKEQAIPTIDADQAHALLSSGHGYVDVRYACTVYTEASMVLRSAANELTGTKWIFSRMREDFDKAHASGARNVPYYLSVTPQGQFLDSACSLTVGACGDRLVCFLLLFVFLETKSVIDIDFKLASFTLIKHVPPHV